MPELPEVETVRRGLQPVMEGAKILHAEARRKDLRFPFQKDFVARLTGQAVTGLGRRAKYLMADLTSGDVLLMHLCMAGSFRVQKRGERHVATPPPPLWATKRPRRERRQMRSRCGRGSPRSRSAMSSTPPCWQ